MDAYDNYLNELINACKAAFAGFPHLKWVNSYSAGEFQGLRDQLLERIGDNKLFKDTKPYYNRISKGCNICGRGLWSCLFITGKCNANCFYCPASQKSDDIPGLQGLTFPTPASYAEYIQFFNFKGVSFSGGEPLLVQDRLLSYLAEVKKICSGDLYTWMYTNGILANGDIFAKLASAGLDEVRFDIGATNYSLSKIKYAKHVIPNITIEIPAVLEEKEKIKALLPEMIKAGVTNLNLHQLRLTKHNVNQLCKRNYTYIAAEKPVVLESELAALEIVDYARSHQMEIGVNYCSFFFKNRFQQAGFRKLISHKLAPKDAKLSEKGYLRDLGLNEISYKKIVIADEGCLPGNCLLLDLQHKKYDYKTETIHSDNKSTISNHQAIKELVATEPENPPTSRELFAIWQHEYIEKGLREY